MQNWANAFISDAQALRNETQELLQRMHWKEAAICLEMLVTVNPDDPWVRQWQVIVAMALGRTDEAIERANEALTVIPEQDKEARADVMFNLGQALVLRGRHTDALDTFSKALLLNPSLKCAEQARTQLMNRK